VPQVLAALPQARFILVGDGPERSALESRALQLGIGPHIEFLGLRRDISQILSRFDVFVLPSLREGLPNAVLEAMAWGLPVVATRVGGVPEVVTASETGLLVAPGAPDELAQAMITLGTDATRRARYGHAAQAIIASRFSPEREFRETEAVYLRLLGGIGAQAGSCAALSGSAG
jgi:glycosyltransferase involved in cell wall biosynthesis